MDTRKIDLNLLVTFEALLAERNVTHAARRLGLSQPAVSTQLARLRDLFGDALFVPGSRGMTPTVRALELQKALVPALAGMRDVVSAGESFDLATANLTVAVAGSDHAQHVWLMPFAVAMKSKAPQLRFALRVARSDTLEKQMERGEIDLAIYPPHYAAGSLLSKNLGGDPYAFIARRGHPIVKRRIELRQFLALDHVLTEPTAASFMGPTDRALEALGRRRCVVLSVSSFLVAVEAVAQSDLVALVPQSIARNRKDQLQVLQPPLDVPDNEFLLLWHPRTQSHPGHRWVRDALAANIARALKQ